MFNPHRHHRPVTLTNTTDAPSGHRSSHQLHLETTHLAIAPAAFFRFWKPAVQLAGARFFGNGRLADATLATSKDELRPIVPLILQTIEMLQPHEQIFLAALLSFYDATEGGRLLQQFGVGSLADFHRLNFQQRTLLAGLFLNHIGW